jgi:arginine exporter protein ArgO
MPEICDTNKKIWNRKMTPVITITKGLQTWVQEMPETLKIKVFNHLYVQALVVIQPLPFCRFCLSALYLLTTITTELPFFAHLSVLYKAKRQTKSKKQLKKIMMFTHKVPMQNMCLHIFFFHTNPEAHVQNATLSVYTR